MKISKGLLFLSLGLFYFILQSCYQEANASSNVKSAKAELIQWHSIEEVNKLAKDDPKPMIVDVYTDWCKWCKVMDEKTFSDPNLINYLSDNYHMVKFNAETAEPLNFKGQTYEFIKNGRRGYNTLAAALCQGKLSYPSFVVLDEDLNTVQVINGFKDAEAFKALLDKNSL